MLNRLLFSIKSPRKLAISPPNLILRQSFASTAPTTNLPLFDTHKLVSTLKDSGFNESQSISIMNALVKAMQDMSVVNQQTQATKAEFTALQSEINEKIFNLTLKFDMAWCKSIHFYERFDDSFLNYDCGLDFDSTANQAHQGNQSKGFFSTEE
jgi:hypothetical protein